MFIQVTPEGYTPDGAYRLVPVDIEPHELQSIYQHAMGQSLRERDAREVGKFRASVVSAAPPPPAEMMFDKNDLLAALISLAAVARRYLPDYDEHPEIQKADAAIDAARGK